jgi:hypothetical protein
MRRAVRPSLALAALGIIGVAVWAKTQIAGTGNEMALSAERLLATLTGPQRAQATFPFDSPERLNWHFIPRPRKGLPIKEMDGAQRALAFGLLRSGLGAPGYLKATTIMSLEAVLKELEAGSGPTRDPELYYVSIFGTPSNRGKWGWRVEGHHLSLNFTLDGGRIVGATPAFFGANPAEVRQGPRQGLRTLADLEDRALRLLQALDDDQKTVAVIAPKAPGEIRGANTPQPPTDAAEGIPVGKLHEDQRQMLRALIEAYAADMPEEVAHAWLAEIQQAGVEPIAFAWSGPADRTQPHAYRVQGPTFLIEFNNTQNGANHVHSVWRNMLGDFGVPVAAR